MALYGAVHEAYHRRLVGHVAHRGAGLPAECVGDPPGVVCVEVGDHHRGPFGGVGLGDRTADTTGCAGHHGDLVVEPAHAQSPPAVSPPSRT